MTDPLLTRLANADIAQTEMPVDEGLLRRVLAAAVPSRRRARRGLRALAVVAAAALVLTAGALAAGHRLPFTGSAKTQGMFSNPHSSLGSIVPGSARLLALAVADPAGGPPWGLRTFTTTRGVGCLQVGRLQDGKLGALGRDRAFHNDGKFHALAVDSPRWGEPPLCAPLDANKRTFINAGIGGIPTSAIESCASPEFTRGAPARLLCRPEDERALYFGLLGPEASAIAYTVAGQRHTVPTVGPEGAYLIVAPTVSRFGDGMGAGAAIPFEGPPTRIDARDGKSCSPYPRGPYRHHVPCQLKGYAARPVSIPTQAEVSSPVHVRVVGRRLRVSFTARIPVTSTQRAYGLWVHRPGGGLVGQTTQRDIAAGETVVLRMTAKHPGVYRGGVQLDTSTGGTFIGAPPGEGVLVGRFAVRVR